MRFLLILLIPFSAFAQKVPLFNTNTMFLTPSNLLASNFIAGANFGIVKGASGELTLSSSATQLLSTATVSNNFGFLFSTQLAGTNNAALTNITFLVGPSTNQRAQTLYLTNNATFTNFTGMAAGVDSLFEVWVIPKLVTRTITWPTLGSATLGILVQTNIGQPMWTSLTNDVTYLFTMRWRDTNALFTISAFK